MKQAYEAASILKHSRLSQPLSPISVRHGTCSACKLLSAVLGCRTLSVRQVELASSDAACTIPAQSSSATLWHSSASWRLLRVPQVPSSDLLREPVRSDLHNGMLHAASACCINTLFAVLEGGCLPAHFWCSLETHATHQGPFA